MVAPEAWRLQLPSHWKIHDVFHTSQLKLAVGDVRLREPLLVDESEEFEVEAVIDKRHRRGKLEYLIRWIKDILPSTIHGSQLKT